MHIYVMGWLSGLLPKAWMTDQIKVSTAESLSDTTLLFTLSNGAGIRLGVEYLPPDPKASLDSITVPPALLGIDPDNGPSVGVEHPVPDVNKFQVLAEKINQLGTDLAPAFEKMGAAASQVNDAIAMIGVDPPKDDAAPMSLHELLEEYKAKRQAELKAMYQGKLIPNKVEYQGNWTEPDPVDIPNPPKKSAWPAAGGGIVYSSPKPKPVKWSPKASDFWMGVTDTTDAVDLADEVAQADPETIAAWAASPQSMTAKQWIGQQRIKTRVQNWINKLNGQVPSSYSFSLGVTGKKFQRVTMTHKDGTKSVHAFVDLSTGLVYKAATWKAPAAGPRYDLGIEASYQALMNDCDWAGSYLYYQGNQSYTLPQST